MRTVVVEPVSLVEIGKFLKRFIWIRPDEMAKLSTEELLAAAVILNAVVALRDAPDPQIQKWLAKISKPFSYGVWKTLIPATMKFVISTLAARGVRGNQFKYTAQFAGCVTPRVYVHLEEEEQ